MTVARLGFIAIIDFRVYLSLHAVTAKKLRVTCSDGGVYFFSSKFEIYAWAFVTGLDFSIIYC